MRLSGSDIVLSATDLASFLACRHRTALDLAAARGTRKRPYRAHDPLLDILIERGRAHEANYVQLLRMQGRQIVDLTGLDDREEAMERARHAMHDGADVIVQAALGDTQWFGYADILQRVERPSALGPWSYEVADTKLALETRGGTILQLSLYSELVGEIQGVRPTHFHVVTPHRERPIQTFRLDDYAAYARLVRRQLLDSIARGAKWLGEANYPEPVDHCSTCHWAAACRARRVADDHLSLVAGITRMQRDELGANGIPTLTSLAQLTRLPFKPARGSADSYERVIAQAVVQLESRTTSTPVHRLRELAEEQGLARLPEPSPGDVFLDLEGDPHAVEGGREYLFGLVSLENGEARYRSWWGMTAAGEKRAFEAVMDHIRDRLRADPGMHVYHYAPYEPSAFKRLMGRYVTREAELDELLRGGRFVDLYAVVRQGLFIGVERYSIKNLEPLYGYSREVDLADASRALRAMEQHLQLGLGDDAPAAVRDAVEGYNRDDCISTWRLREWLERVRADAVRAGMSIPRWTGRPEEAPEQVTEKTQRVEDLRARLLTGIPDEPGERTPEQRARWLLAYLLDWHRREDKASWWEYFRLRELAEEDLIDEPRAIAGLRYAERVGMALGKRGTPTKSVIDRYTWPPQEMEIREGAELQLAEGTWGRVVAIDRVARTIDVHKGPSRSDVHPTSVFEHTHFASTVIEESLLSVGTRVANAGSVETDTIGATRELLLGTAPRLRPVNGERPRFDGTRPSADRGVDLVMQLDGSVLPVQGPPGSGKTYTGARMICALVQAGKRVGVTANSHKVILNLLDAVAEQSQERGIEVGIGHRGAESDLDGAGERIMVADTNAEAIRRLEDGEVQVMGGTAWFWSRSDTAGLVDVLFVDEAGQMSLANTVAVSPAARSLVLLGDPQQLEQPSRGSHPDGVSNSALHHMLGGRQVMPPDLGLFLPVTWRLAPAVCAFTSETYYEGQLRSRDGLERQVLSGCGEFDGSGLRLVEVEHTGNRAYADAEVDVVAQVVERLLARGACWTDANGRTHRLTASDVLVVAPYNAQVGRLVDRLAPYGVQAGTVDRFQGQEAPVVIYSLASSSVAEAPRGLEFLFSRNRMNVATSRAKCVAILVASPGVFEPECHTPRQMYLANGVCRYKELASG